MSPSERLSHLLSSTRPLVSKLGLYLEPAFIIIGTQKGGTSSLYRYLALHPDVRGAARKEMHFFDRHYTLGSDWYRSQFPIGLGRSKAVTGEATPYYMFHPEIPHRVAGALPNVKLIVLLRDPVDRAYSHYQHTVRHHVQIPTFEEALEIEQRLFAERRSDVSFYDDEMCHRHSYAIRGRYVDQLTRWYDVFPREQLLVLRSEDLYREPAEHFNIVLDFIGLEEWAPKRFATYNEGGYSQQEISGQTRAALRSYYRPYNKRLSELLSMDFSAWDR